MAKAAKLMGSGVNVYTLLGDGEIEEGEVWEACMFAAHYKLDNLCVIIDLNGLQIDGATRDVMNSDPVPAKFEAFGFRHIQLVALLHIRRSRASMPRRALGGPRPS